jgi:hypothetical protein
MLRAGPVAKAAAASLARPTRVFLLFSIASFVLPVVTPAVAQGCARWDVTGGWAARQSNNFNPIFELVQPREGQRPGTQLTGTVRMTIFGTTSMREQRGTVTGSTDGNRIILHAKWNGGTTGVYDGTMDAGGNIRGTTFDERNAAISASWTSNRPMRCPQIAAAPPPPPPPPAPIPQGQGVQSGMLQVGRPPSAAALQPTNLNCKSGFVWRVIKPDDLVCVTPESRARAAEETRTAASRVQPGAAPNCRSGFVWRAAVAGDAVCVTPEVRKLVQDENRAAASRRAP